MSRQALRAQGLLGAAVSGAGPRLVHDLNSCEENRMLRMLRRRARWVACFFGLAIAALPLAACPFCSMQGQTLTGDINQASMVLFGTLTNAKLDASGAVGQGTTDLQIEAIIKPNPILGNRKVVTLPRYVPTENNSTKFLIFCDVYKGQIDPYRGVPVKPDSDIVRYLQGAMAVKDKDIGTRLRYFFDFLDNADVEISNDAYKEFGNADYKDYREMAKGLPADKLAKWLQDADTPSFRYGLYASMLGHCGSDRHAAVLRKMLDDPQKRLSSGVDGILAGYTLLKPQEGWVYINGLLKDPSKEFMLRYAALRAARFFWDSRPDVVPRKQLAEGVGALLDQSDVADLAIEDLRKWGQWDMTDRVLAIYDRKSHAVPIVRRAVLRFALSSPAPHATAFVDSMRKKDPDTVKDVEELLKLEVGDKAVKPAAAAAGGG
jgi:hypothetical protein